MSCRSVSFRINVRQVGCASTAFAERCNRRCVLQTSRRADPEQQQLTAAYSRPVAGCSALTVSVTCGMPWDDPRLATAVGRLFCPKVVIYLIRRRLVRARQKQAAHLHCIADGWTRRDPPRPPGAPSGPLLHKHFGCYCDFLLNCTRQLKDHWGEAELVT
jgi:hypothetical protein